MCGQMLTGATHKAGDSGSRELSEVVHDGHAVCPLLSPLCVTRVAEKEQTGKSRVHLTKTRHADRKELAVDCLGRLGRLILWASVNNA